jgi:REP element-mobilizing transposase RayT
MTLENNNISKNQTPRSAWRSRGYIPHFDSINTPQFITIGLFDTLPKHVLDRWQTELSITGIDDTVIRKRIEAYLDNGQGSKFLRVPDVANLVEQSILFHDGCRYRLHAWVIMPNHLHILITPLTGQTLDKIMHSLKSFTSSEANKILGRQGTFWRADYFDRFIRDEKHFKAVVDYIERNPVKARLCKEAFEWRWNSAWWRTSEESN